MEYQIIEKKNYYIVKILGIFSRHAVYSLKLSLKPLLTKPKPRIAIDLGGFTFEKSEIIYQIGLLNAIRSRVKLAGGTLKICSLTPILKHYLFENRLNSLFDLYEDLDSIEQDFQLMHN